MFDMLTGQYKNLASKGRYGDTMLAHINPEEAAMLQSMGGTGTVNPQTGLREFFNVQELMSQFPAREPLPSLGQALAPESLANLSTQLNTTTVPQVNRGLGGSTAAYEKVSDDYSQYVDQSPSLGMGGGRQVQGYTLPSQQTFQGKPLEVKYDDKGNFQYLQIAGGDYLTPDPNQPNIVSSPKINAKGEIVDFGVYDLSKQEDGGFVSMVRELGTEFAPMILAAAGSSLLGPTAGAGAAGGAAGGGAALSPYAAQAAGAYGGSAAAAGAAAAGNLAGIQTASLGQNALTQAALGRTGITYGGNVTPADIPTTNTPTTPPAEVSAEIPFTPPVVPPTGGSVVKDALLGASGYGALVTPAELAAAAGGLGSLGDVGTAILNFAKDNPSISGALLGAVTSAVSAANAPTSQTTTSSIDPDIKKKYLAYLKDAETAAAGLLERKFAPTDQMYTTAETQLNTLGLTPFGATDIKRFFDPYEEKVVAGALGDIESVRKTQEQANRDRAIQARAFGGSRQGVVTGMTNEAALRQSANTAAQLRSAGYTQAANLGLTARPLDFAGLQTSLGLGTARTTLAQQKLDAARNLALEKLSITGGALGLQPGNTGGTTSQPLYSNVGGSLLSGGLTGAYIGSLLQPNQPKVSLG